MGLPVHTVEFINGSTPPQILDRVQVYYIPGLANVAGGSAGASVTIAVTGKFPSTYAVFVNPSQDAVWFVTQASQLTTGFTITLNPRLATNTLAAGSVDVLVVG